MTILLVLVLVTWSMAVGDVIGRGGGHWRAGDVDANGMTRSTLVVVGVPDGGDRWLMVVLGDDERAGGRVNDDGSSWHACGSK